VLPPADRPYAPGYDLEPSSDGLLPWSWAVERLTIAAGYWLASRGPRGVPHLMPIWGVWLHDRFAFSTGETSRKARNLAADPRCSVSTSDTMEAVVLEGEAAALPDEVLGDYYRAYNDKYSMTGDPEPGGHWIVVPHTAFGFIDRDDEFTRTARRWRFPPR
jgi:hypothetical protein